MSRTIKKGATSQSVYFDVLDSTSTTGGRKTGLAYNTSSLVAYYMRGQSTATAITLATLAAANTAWSSGGFKEVDATNMPGIYRLDVPDAAFASGAGDDVVVVIKGATGMVQASVDVQLVAYDPQDTVRAGLTALPNAAAEAAGGLYTRGTGAGQINQDANGRVDVNGKAWAGGAIPSPNVTGVPLVDDKYLLGTVYSTPATAGIQDINLKNIANAAVSTSTAQLGVNAVNHGGTAQTGRDIGASVLLSAGTGAGQLDFTSGVVKANLVQILATALTETAGQIAGGFKKFFNIATPAATMDHGVLVDTVTTYTGNTPQTGDAYARIGAAGAGLTALGDTRIAHLDADVSTRASPTNITAGTITTVTNLTNAPTSGDLTATMKDSVTTAATAATPIAASVTGAVGSVAGLTASNLDVAVSTRLASGSYTSPPSAATIAQAVWDVLTSALTTVGTIGKLLVTNIDAAISSRSSYAGGDTAGTTTLLSRLGSPSGATIAADIAAVKSDTGATKAKTDNLPSDPADQSLIIAATDAIKSDTGSIKNLTDVIVHTSGKLWVLDDSGNPLPHSGAVVNADVKKVNGVTVNGDGAGTPWGP